MVLVALQFKMEMTQVDNSNTPKSYSLNMYSDFVPMCIFSESNQGSSQLYLINFLHDVSMYYLSSFVQIFI